MTKEVLAFGWHVTDGLLDVFEAPRWLRITVAGIGVAWSAYFLAEKLTEKSYTETHRELENFWKSHNL